MRRPLVSFSLAAALLAPALPARADTVAECIGAHEHSVDLRKQGRLLDARREVAACAGSACPEVVQQACIAQMAEINAAMPSVVFDVRDGAGQPVANVRVAIDGTPAGVAGTAAVAIDPGTHAVRLEAPGQSPVDLKVVVLEGEKNKRVEARIGPEQPKTEPVGRLVVTADTAAIVSIDGKASTGGRFDGRLSASPHQVSVTEAGKKPYEAQVDVREGETRTLEVSLEAEKSGASPWPWIAGGAAVAVGAVIGGYFLFKPSNTTEPVPAGKTAALQLASWKLQ